MKRFRIVVMVPHVKEVVVTDAQAAHNEASVLVAAQALGELKAQLNSIEFIEDIETEPMDFGGEVA